MSMPDLPRLAASPEALSDRGLMGYASACKQAGESVVQCGGTWWREVRPCLFRPLLPFLDVQEAPAGLPFRSAFGGYQYPSCAGGDPPNSILAYVAFDDAKSYCLERVRPKRRTQIRSAERHFVIRPLSNTAQFRARAYSVYLEFHDRTKYHYLNDRVRKPRFERWINAQFSDPGLVALGAWAGDFLVAVSLSRVIGRAWVYSSFFASNEALHGHVANLMLHHVRSLAATVPDVSIVFAGMQKGVGGRSVDEFYFHHGATLIRRPAVLRMNPLLRWLLPRLRPESWARLHGDFSTAGAFPSPGRDVATGGDTDRAVSARAPAHLSASR